MSNTIGVGLVGYKFMGKAHSNGYRQVAAFFPDVALRPVMKAICGRDEAAVRAAAAQFGWEGYETDWRKLVARDDIQLIDVSTPGDTHAAISIAAAENGKHVFCEKPLANTLAEARQMLDAVQRNKVVGMVNFNYRRVPAVQLAKSLIDSGRLGTIYQLACRRFAGLDYGPELPAGLALQKDVAGSGLLGDLGADIISGTGAHVGWRNHIRRTGLTEMFISATGAEPQLAGWRAAAGAEMGEVTVDDAALFLARFANGAVGTFEVTRFAKGRANYNSFEINGSKGSLRFNLERMNELEVLLDDDMPDVAGFRTVLVTNGNAHKYLSAWWPAGHIIGWEHTFTHGIYDLLNGIAAGVSPAPTFEDGLRCQAILDAVERSAGSKQWVAPEY
ncbi:MAG: Gfo/Idh/MocA family oxidoreductase [Roseiflexaceae bacterium]|nr:Gfo/Idh/MocA family oxidoreductase [Roseiflexaceae bacterium]